MLVTMTRKDLRELIREEIRATRSDQSANDRFLDAAEAAKMLSMSEDWLYRANRRTQRVRQRRGSS
jgi:hypothetical protein